MSKILVAQTARRNSAVHRPGESARQEWSMSSPQPVPFQTSLAAGRNRRLHARLPISCEVYLGWQDRQESHILRARAVNISKFGMLVEAENPITPGGVVSVETKAMLLGHGCVRHCTAHGSKYRIGVHLPDRMTSLLVSVEPAI